MMIEAAERYGISQLHQLRGRIGRGEHASLCILFGDPNLPRLAGDRARTATASSSPRSTSSCAARATCSARASTGCRCSAWRASPRTPSCSSWRAQRADELLDRDPELEAPEHALLRERRPCAQVTLRRSRSGCVRCPTSRHPNPADDLPAPGGRRLTAPAGRGPPARRPTASARRCSRSSAPMRRRCGCSTCSPARGRSGSRRCRAGAARRCSSSQRPARRRGDPSSQPRRAWARTPQRPPPRRRSPGCGARRRGQPFDLVFVDPPYSSAGRMAGAALRAAARRCSPTAPCTVTESDKRDPLHARPCRCSTSASTATPGSPSTVA